MTQTINVKVNTVEINPKNLNILYINIAQKSFFDSTFGKVVGGALSAAGGQAFQIALSILLGQKDSAELVELKKIADQINTLSADVSVVAMSTVQLQAKTNIKNKLTAVNNIISQNPQSITFEQVHELVRFLSAGVEGVNYGNYASCIDNLLNVTYGINKNDMINAANAKTNCQMGRDTECYAYQLNNKQLSQPIGVFDYVEQHTQLASKTAALTLGICIVANRVYNYLNDNKDYFFNVFPNIKNDADKVLNNAEVKAEVSEIASVSFLPTLLGQTFAAAPATLCDIAYELVTRMSYNASGKGWVNTNIRIYNSNGNIDSKEELYGKWKAHDTFYNNIGGYWTASFTNNTPSNKINLAGRHSGFLGFMGDAVNSYVNEIMDSNFDIYFDTHVKYSLVVPGYKMKNCIWTMKVKQHEGKKVFLSNNELYPDLNLAHNHGFLVPTCPGQYKASAENPDQFWQIALKD